MNTLHVHMRKDRILGDKKQISSLCLLYQKKSVCFITWIICVIEKLVYVRKYIFDSHHIKSITKLWWEEPHKPFAAYHSGIRQTTYNSEKLLIWSLFEKIVNSLKLIVKYFCS